MPVAGTDLQTPTKAPQSPSYGSFGHTKIKILSNESANEDDTVDNDSGMSSEENEDSLKLIVSDNIDVNISSSVGNKREVITKCLITEPQCDEHWNEIPCCSNDVTNVSVFKQVKTKTESLLSDDTDTVDGDNKVSDFIVIDLTCNVNDLRDAKKRERKVVATNASNIDCDLSSIHSIDTSQSLVPVLNNEIVNSENQKLVSLSLSILLAALLQAMRCFAQFLENIVIPQR